MISELLFALSRLADPRASYVRQSGHTNTGWTRYTLSLPSNFDHHSPLPDPDIPPLTSPNLPAYYNTASPSPSLSPPSDSSIPSNTPNPISSLPSVTLRKTHTNITIHLNGLKRTKGGVGSEQFDARQKSLKDFFSGGGGRGDVDETPAKVMDLPDLPGVDPNDTSTNEGRTAASSSSSPEYASSDGKRGIRVKSPPSPSPTKKGKLT